jgi:hypothetical protein
MRTTKAQKLLSSRLTLLRRSTLLSQIILTRVLGLETIFVQHLVEQFHILFASRLKDRGLPDTIKWLKGSRLLIVRFILGNPLFEFDGIKVDSKGFPTELAFLHAFIELGTKEGLKALFTLLNIGRCFIYKADPDTSTISDKWKGFDSVSESELLTAFTNLNITNAKIGEFEGKFHMSTKRGPQGQALLTCLTELTLLPQELRDSIELLGGSRLKSVLNKLLGSHWGLSWAKLWSMIIPSKSNNLRKLSYFGDPEGKVRVIAIFDYWSQTALLPLHKGIMKLLSKLEMDGTKDQSFFTRKKLMPSDDNSFWSLDLTAATDRMPIALQKRVVKRLYGSEDKAKAWEYIMTALPFTLQVSNNDTRTLFYGAGQPMGAYSSWAVMALTHHIIVQVAAQRAGVVGLFKQYCLLGDDIRIDVDKVAQEYIKLLSELDMPVSMQKTHTSKEGFEFAKRWFINGEEITGFSISGLLSVCKSYSQLVNFFENQIAHGFVIPFEEQVGLIPAVHKVIYDKRFIINKAKSMQTLFTVFYKLQIFIKTNIYTEPEVMALINTINTNFGFTFFSPSDVSADVLDNLKKIINLAKKELIERDMKRFTLELGLFHKKLFNLLTVNVPKSCGATKNKNGAANITMTISQSDSGFYKENEGYLGIFKSILKPGIREMIIRIVMYSSSSLIYSNTRAGIIASIISDELTTAHPLFNCINTLLTKGANASDDLDDRKTSNHDVEWIFEEGLAKYFLSKGTFSMRKSESKVLAQSAMTKLVINIFARMEKEKKFIT